LVPQEQVLDQKFAISQTFVDVARSPTAFLRRPRRGDHQFRMNFAI